jgi:hypothetical protein
MPKNTIATTASKASGIQNFLRIFILSLLLRHVAQSGGLAPENYLRIRLADISDLIHADGAAATAGQVSRPVFSSLSAK